MQRLLRFYSTAISSGAPPPADLNARRHPGEPVQSKNIVTDAALPAGSTKEKLVERASRRRQVRFGVSNERESYDVRLIVWLGVFRPANGGFATTSRRGL